MENLPRLLRRLGTGGMGEVWLAEDSRRGIIAVKQLLPEFSESDGLARFRAEFAALSRLRHAHLVEAYDYLVYPSGRQGYTMEYVEGLDFTSATGGLGYEDVLKLVEQVCEALEHVHSHDLIHGDIKPGNLLVRGGAVKLMDFGLAERPGPRGVRGSLDYLAPEVIQGRPRDRRADLYALGAVLFEALTRRTPFHGQSRFALLRAHLRSQPAFPARSIDSVPEPVRRAVLRLLCKDPSARYFTAAETAEALRAARGAAGRRELRPESIGGMDVVAGRDRELEALEAALRRAAAGEGPEVQVVEGPAGAGKTALLRVFSERLAARHVAQARSAGASGSPPFAAVRDWLASLAAFASPEWPRLRSALAAIDAGEATAPGEAAEALEAAARQVPLVLFLLSAEWVDGASLEVLAKLRLRPRLRLLVVAAVTPLEGTARWEAARIEMGPIGPGDAAELARQSSGASAVDPAFALALHAAAGGNPGAVRACLRALAAEGALFVHDGILRATAPPSTGPGLERAVAFLGTDARLAAEALAVLARPVPLRDVARLAGLALDRAATAVFDLERRGIAAREDGPLGPRVRFAAPAVAPALLAGAPPEALRAMHRAAAQIAAESALPGAAARHLFETGGGPAAVAAAIEAARHSSGPAPAVSAGFLERALADPACDESQGRAARALLAECRALLGDAPAAAALFRNLAATAGATERDALHLRAASLLARIDPAAALALVDSLPPGTARSVTRAEAFAAMGRYPESLLEARQARDSASESRALLALGRPAESFDAALAAASDAERSGDPAAAARAALVAAESALEREDPGGAAAAATIASAFPGPDALAARAVSVTLRESPAEALSAWRRAGEAARGRGDADGIARAGTGAARILTAHDRLGEAVEAAEEAVAARATDRRQRFSAALAACAAASRLGRHESALRHAERAVEEISPAGPTRSLARALAAQARAMLAAGRVTESLAAAEASRAADPAGDPLALLQVSLGSGDHDSVLHAAPRLAPSSPRDAATLAELRARALGASGDPTGVSAAVDEFYEVLSRARELGAPALARRAHAGLGRALLQLGLGRSARDHLRLALDLLRDALTHVPPGDREGFLALPENLALRAAILAAGAV